MAAPVLPLLAGATPPDSGGGGGHWSPARHCGEVGHSDPGAGQGRDQGGAALASGQGRRFHRQEPVLWRMSVRGLQGAPGTRV